MSYIDRVTRYSTVATALALHSDRRLAQLVDAAPQNGVGIGGTTKLLDVEGVRVFVKRVPLTDLERRPENVMSTANVFKVPPFYHYGLGSSGASAWRELAAHTMTTNWVLSRHSESFPLLYHWRVLPGQPREPDRAELDRAVEWWNGSPAVRERLTALGRSTTDIVLFLEYVPFNLRDWLATQDPTKAAFVEDEFGKEVPRMSASGLLHFDAHFGNILTDGERLYFSDFGLAASPKFELDADERTFVQRNATHDRAYTLTHLVNWLVTTLTGISDPAERNAFVRAYSEGALPTWADEIVRRHAPTAAVMNEFYWKLYTQSRATQYPHDAVSASTGASRAARTAG
jgi:hypothetical protein